MKVARYSKTCQKITGIDNFRYQLLEEVGFAGGKDGYLQKMLQNSMAKHQNEPYYWHLDVPNCLAKIGNVDESLVAFLDSNNGTSHSLYEIINIWGRSAHGWTQILLHFCRLFTNENLEDESREKDFNLFPAEMDNPIFAISHFTDSTIENGEFIGKWSLPPTSLTLLWPETAEYFTQQITGITKNAAYLF